MRVAGGATEPGRRLLGVFYSPDSVELRSLVRATRKSWDLALLVERDRLAEPADLPQPGRFGDVVDISGLSPRELARALPRIPDGLLASTDADLALAAELAAELGLAGIDPDIVRRLTDKRAQREALRAAGLPVPRIVSLRSDADAATVEAATAGLRFPCVLKPARGTGSRATCYVGSAAAVADRLAERRDCPVEDFVIEERIPDGWDAADSPWADYVSVESFVHDGQVEHFGVTGRTPLASDLRETGSILPAEIAPELRSELLALAGRAIEALGVRVGVTHTEIKLSPPGPRVIEVNGRLGGGGVRWLAERVAGTSLLAASARVNLGLPAGVSGAEFTGVGFAWYLQPPPDARQVASLPGITEAAALPGVEDVIVLRGPGAALNPGEDGSLGAVLTVRGWLPTHAEVAALIARLAEVLRPDYS